MNKANYKATIELVLRQTVFIILNIYALSKLLGGQFYMKGNLPTQVANTTLGEASGFSLAWTFMGHSYLYILFVGVFQLLGAWFLLWNKTKLLGILMLVPIMINIIVFDLIFLDVYPALANAIIVFLMLCLILLLNKALVKSIVIKLTSVQSKSNVPIKNRLITFGVTIVLIVLIFSFDSLIEYWLGASKEKII